MHPIVAHDLARGRIADFHAEADADRRVLAARQPAGDHAVQTTALWGSRWPGRPDPTGLVRRVLARLHPAVAP